MKVDGSGPADGQNILGRIQESSRNQETERSVADSQPTKGGKDKISLSNKAKEINELKGIIEQLPDIRTDKVEGLKKVIDSGNYNIDSMKVAEKILEEI